MSLLQVIKHMWMKLMYKGVNLDVETIINVRKLLKESSQRIMQKEYVLGEYGDNEYKNRFKDLEIFVGMHGDEKLVVRVYTTQPELKVYLHSIKDLKTHKLEKDINSRLSTKFLNQISKTSFLGDK